MSLPRTPLTCIMARSIIPLSSARLPGNEYDCSARMASGVISLGRVSLLRPSRELASLRAYFASASISNARRRSGGTLITVKCFVKPSNSGKGVDDVISKRTLLDASSGREGPTGLPYILTLAATYIASILRAHEESKCTFAKMRRLCHLIRGGPAVTFPERGRRAVRGQAEEYVLNPLLLVPLAVFLTHDEDRVLADMACEAAALDLTRSLISPQGPEVNEFRYVDLREAQQLENVKRLFPAGVRGVQGAAPCGGHALQ
eukprot:scaffold1809_cov386-Prasinococcus_capsulatus_cf.AAC.29